MRRKIENKREERREEIRDERRVDFVEKCLKINKKKTPDELSLNIFNLNPVGRIICSVQNLTRFSIIYVIRIRMFGPRE